MSKYDGRGYKIPEIAQPEGIRCITVAIPDDDMYLYAFMGAYEFFTTWVAWEKDEQKRARFAAQAWKEAYDITRELMCYEPIDYSPFIQPLIDAIGNISVNVSNNVNCGGGCGGCGDSITAPTPPEWTDNPITDTGDPDNPLNPPENFPPETVYDEYKCKAANKLADDWIATIVKMGTLSGLLSAIGVAAFALLLETSLLGGLIVGLMALGLSASGAIVILIAAFTAIALSGGAGLALFVDLGNGINRDELACAFYNSATVTDARIAFESAVANSLDDLQGEDGYSALAGKIGDIMGVLMPDSTLAVLFNYEESVDAYSSEFDCSSCVAGGQAWEHWALQLPHPAGSTLVVASNDFDSFSWQGNAPRSNNANVRYDVVNLMGIGSINLPVQTKWVRFTVDQCQVDGFDYPNFTHGNFAWGSDNNNTDINVTGTYLIRSDSLGQNIGDFSGDAGANYVIIYPDDDDLYFTKFAPRVNFAAGGYLLPTVYIDFLMYGFTFGAS